MGTRIKCPKCGIWDRYESSEIHNLGTSFVPQFAVDCHSCNFLIASKEKKDEKKPFYLHSRKSDKELLSEISSILSQKKLPEIILQDYLKKEFKYYGFLEIEGPFNKGPDFKIFLDGQYKWLEVETDAQDYKKHSHHLSKNFDKVEMLFYLYDYKHNSKYHQILPQVHVKADIIHFKGWFYKKIDQKYYVRNIIERCNAIYNEYARIYLNEFCDKRGDDMAICPHCFSCAYFNNEWIMDCTDRFLKINSEILYSDKYDFNKVTYKKLHEIFE